MKTILIHKKIFSLLITIAIVLSVIPNTVSSTSNYKDIELARAVSLDFGTYKSTNPQITYAQFMKMLDHVVELTDKTKLVEWRKLLPEARKSDKKMTRFNGMLAIMYTSYYLGDNYTEFNTVWWDIHDKIGNVWDECIKDYSIWGDWPEQQVSEGFKNALYTYDWNYSALSYFYSFGRMSVISKKTIFDYSADKNSMRPAEKFTYKEALLAALRLYDSVKPISERYATAEDKAILNTASERKQAILNSPSTVTSTCTSYYVSNTGDDNNDGLTPETAWATLDKVNSYALKYGDAVFFKRGDLWRINPMKCQDGVIYSAYGEGEKPRIYGSQENSAGADKWKLLAGTKNIWVYYKNMPFCGYIVFNEGRSIAQKKWVYWNGTQYVKDGTNEKFTLDGLKNLEYFNNIDLKGWNNYVYSDLIVYDCPRTGKLYLRCDEGNPGLIYDSIEIAPKYEQVALLELGKGNVIDNLCLKYYGLCGIIGNGTVQNCEMGYFGGANFSFRPEDKSAVSAGGGINVGVTDEDGIGAHIMNNLIYESSDEAITIECGWNGVNYGETFSNILIKDNIFEKNRHDCWISSFMEDRKGIIFKNITYDGNMFLFTGTPSCGLNLQDTAENAGIAVNDPGERNIEDIVVKNNTFYLSSASLIFINSYHKEDITFSDNTYVTNNNAIFLARGFDEMNYYYNFFGDAPERYLNDQTSIILPISLMPSLSLTSATVKIGEKYTIPLAHVNPITLVSYKITSGDKYISVSNSGIITAKKAGIAKISVTFSNGINRDVKQTLSITVKK